MKKGLVVLCILFCLSNMLYATGNILVEAEPQNAEVYIDGKFAGFAPLKLTNVSAGFHKIMVVRPDALPYMTSVIVEEGRDSYVKAVFNIQAQPKIQQTYTQQPQTQYPQYQQQYTPQPSKEEIIRQYEEQKRRKAERRRVRIRNTTLGIGLLNEVFTKHKRTRHNLRKGLTGLGLLNELIGR